MNSVIDRHSTRITSSTVEKFWSHQSYEINISNVISYSLKGLRKGAENELEKRTGFRLNETKDQGLIYGKRIGWNR